MTPTDPIDSAGTADVIITIDRLRYAVRPRAVTGADVRRIPHPNIPERSDLWLIGDPFDIPVGANTEVLLASGTAFYTAPANINEG
jgi:hypothetical protein